MTSSLCAGQREPGAESSVARSTADYLLGTWRDGGWRKLKGVAAIRLASGELRTAELHWYEAHGIGRRKVKIKRLLN